MLPCLLRMEGADSQNGAPGWSGPLPEVGDLVAGKYRVERRLARGGMSAVYLARQEVLDRPVALKILHPGPSDAEEPEIFEERFGLEARTLASLRHPNIVVVYDYGETGHGSYYLAMEYVDGLRLTDLIRGTRLDPARTVRLIRQVCEALAYAHRRGVVHRDVKLSNVMVRVDDSGDEAVTVVDFGLVKLMEVDSGLTSAGLILGSPHFMAPEQARGGIVDHRVDIYAVGVLVFCCITGRYPFHARNAVGTLHAHMHTPPPKLVDAAPGVPVPQVLEQLVARCLAKAPDDRYTSVDALLADLRLDEVEEVEDEITEVGVEHTLKRAAIVEDEPTDQRRRAVLWLLPLLFVAFAGGLAWGAWTLVGDAEPTEAAVVAPVPDAEVDLVPEPAEAEDPAPEPPDPAPEAVEAVETTPSRAATTRRQPVRRTAPVEVADPVPEPVEATPVPLEDPPEPADEPAAGEDPWAPKSDLKDPWAE